jgi:nitrate reductase NapAB chaperone NapD
MAAAYVLMQLQRSTPQNVLQAIRNIAGVKHAHALAGPTDVIAFVEGADQAALLTTLGALRNLEGIANSDTRIAWEM